MTETELIRSTVLQTLHEVRKHPGLILRTLDKTVSFNYCVTKLCIGRKKLEGAILFGKVQAELKNGRWEIDRKSVEEYFDITK